MASRPANSPVVFLGEDNSVKLGDFGLSKQMASHDFASTYVGTPFYMSPEICAAEKYTLKSDIWSLGCIMYELCTKEPPFNAKTHFQLVQKIKEGRVSPLPQEYSDALGDVIRDCLKVNPDRRPDTVSLLNLPVVKLMRKEQEVVELRKQIKRDEDQVRRQQRDIDARVRNLEGEKSRMRQEIENSVRREWEVKAQLEITRLVQQEIERLQKKFDQEVREKVEVEVERRSSNISHTSIKDFSNSLPSNDIPLSSVSSNGDMNFPNSTELTDVSVDSPEPIKALKKSTRTPFGRAQTMFAGNHLGTPMDIEMGEPSPISIQCLSLSPRRQGAKKAQKAGRNIFAAAVGEARWQPTLANSDDSDEEDDLPPPPSPTRTKSSKNPFKPTGGRPALISQKTAPIARQASQPTIFGSEKAGSAPNVSTLSNAPNLRPQSSNATLGEKRGSSPNRRLSKIPSSTNLLSHENIPLSPQRKPSLKSKATGDDLNKLATKNMAIKASAATGNLAPKGRTLVELAQARAGGRTLDSEGHRSPEPRGRAFAQRMAEKNGGEPMVWDPERDDMPSPFLVRRKKVI